MKRTYRLRARLWAAVVPLWLVCCAGDDTDPNSDTCKKVRADYAQPKLLRDYAAKHGQDTSYLDALLNQMISKHWDCFH